jgi:hypothetical protein
VTIPRSPRLQNQDQYYLPRQYEHSFFGEDGYVSSSKRTKHIKTKYFFVHHFHNSGELDLQYCPTEHMWVDVLTKPLQGAKFHLMHSFLMNCPIDYSEDHVITSIPTSLPMLSKNKISSSSPKHNQPFILLDKPTDILMKKRSLQPTPSSWVCVETKSHGTTVPRSSRTYEHVKAKVTWKDTLFPCRHPTSSPSPCTAKKRALTHKLINISIFNVKLAK